MGRISILALGAKDVRAEMTVRAVGLYVNGRIQWRLDLLGMLAAADVWQIADGFGKVRIFSDLGAALAKIRRATGLEVISVETSFENAPEPGVPKNAADAAMKRAAALSRMLAAAQAAAANYSDTLAAIASYDGRGGMYQARFNEITERAAAVAADISEVQTQQAALPAISIKPDS